jgi:hypothetical protein
MHQKLMIDMRLSGYENQQMTEMANISFLFFCYGIHVYY